jgi:hypothetical protein
VHPIGVLLSARMKTYQVQARATLALILMSTPMEASSARASKVNPPMATSLQVVVELATLACLLD